MTILEAIIFGLMQGITEFFPVSSSGHLFVLKSLFNLEDVPVLFDVYLHIATLLVVILFFNKSITDILKSIYFYLRGRPSDTDLNNLKLFLYLTLCSVVTLVGVVIMKKFHLYANVDMNTVSAFFIITALALLFPSFLNGKYTYMNKKSVIVIGLMQALATLPGISRSGFCISGALICGLKKDEAVRIAFLLSIPAILGSLVFSMGESEELTRSVSFNALLLGMLSSAVFGFISLHLLIFILKVKKFWIFSVYLFILGILGFTGALS